MGQMDFISSIFVRFFFAKLSGKHFTDHTLHMHSTLMRKQWRLTQISVSMCLLIMLSLSNSVVISDQASMYTCSLVSVFCSRHFSVKQLKFEIYLFMCQYSYLSFL